MTALLHRDFAGVPLWGLKDPRLCRLMPLWAPLLAAEGVEARYLLALRHPLDVAASLAARDGIGMARGLLLWLSHLLDAEQATRSAKRVIIQYEDLVGARGWRSIADEIAAGLGIEWPQRGEAAVDAFLAPRCAAAGQRRGEGPDAGAWIRGDSTTHAAPAEGKLQDDVIVQARTSRPPVSCLSRFSAKRCRALTHAQSQRQAQDQSLAEPSQRPGACRA